MHFPLMVMSPSLATAILATPIAEESTRTPAPADDLLIKVKVGDIVKKRDASPEDLDLISVGADRSVHNSRRSDDDNIKVKIGVNGPLEKRDEDDDNINVQVGAGGGLTKRDDDDKIKVTVGVGGGLAKHDAAPDDDTRG